MLGEIWNEDRAEAITARDQVIRRVSGTFPTEWISAGYYRKGKTEHLAVEVSGVTGDDINWMEAFEDAITHLSAELREAGWGKPSWHDQPDIHNVQVRATWVEWTRRQSSKRS